MVSASLVLTSLAVLFIMQIVTIAMIAKTNKGVPQSPKEERPTSQADNRRERPPRQEKRQESRPAVPAPQGQPVTSVDRSLREINLRLRNAERDQERARKNAGQNSGQGGGNRRNDRNRNRRPDRKRENRDGWSPQRRDQQSRPPAPSHQPVSTQPRQQSPTPPPQPQPAPVSEDVEHGRKITVKRRMLRSDEEADGLQQVLPVDTPAEASQKQETPVQPAQPEPQTGQDAPQDEPQGDTPASGPEITFGRR